MNKYRWFVALIILVLASLACQTVTGGGNQAPQLPQVPNNNNVNNNDGVPPVATEAAPPADNGNDNSNDNGGSQIIEGFPAPADATNVVSASDTVTFVTKMSVDDVLAFYRDEYGKQGLTERTSMTVIMGQLFTIVFDGDSSGKAISVTGTDMGDGTTTVVITKQNF